ncbi:MAG: hypothetical protein Q9164_007740, partial [Protoblastenia rupestris]
MNWSRLLALSSFAVSSIFALPPQVPLSHTTDDDTCARYGSPANFTRRTTIDDEFFLYAIRPTAPDTQYDISVEEPATGNNMLRLDGQRSATGEPDYVFKLTDGILRILPIDGTEEQMVGTSVFLTISRAEVTLFETP